MSFLRTLSGAFATSIVTTAWTDQATRHHAELVGLSDRDGSLSAMLAQGGTSPEAANQTIDYLITSQSIMLSTNQIMSTIGVIFLIAASMIWLAPRPRGAVKPGEGGH
jgi:DHA2 family multidrug resistance protein